MPETSIKVAASLPPTAHTSPAALVKATAGAAVVAAVVLVLFVLPAEAGIDPTGAGKAMGITGMAAQSDVAEPAAAVAPGSAAAVLPDRDTIIRSGAWREDEMTILLLPHSGKEIKAHMAAGDAFVFTWSSQGGPIKVDMHGERTNAAEDEFTSYWKERESTSGQGAFTAPFAGTHGWYWRNKGETPVTVKVRTSGFYTDLFQPE